MMKKMIFVLLLATICSASMAQTPTKPQSDLSAGQILTAAWLNSMFGTIYTWAQSTNASVTTILAGTTYGTPVTASVTAAVATTTAYLVWDSTALNYVSMSGSGTYGFECDVVAVASGGADSAKFRIDGVMYNNATETSLIASNVVTFYWRTTGAVSTWDCIATTTAVGKLLIVASSPADIKWKARLISHEITY
jgi:hypothetical protein